ncbi:cupin domain-containing protein [Pseudomonas sp. PB101]|uniref:cupin domain-containing protein n=1 Tax=Pseudomonas sp. PB101 TaxID=2495428 RepID=UPI001365B472|nr:cupin domain-containing protein [Pseudomonas sp. PB101]MVW84808.1 cupin domain-containing protein [Pseudomonas sp. PB101]
MQPLPDFKRIVTGHDINGNSIVTHYGVTPNIFKSNNLPNMITHDVWRTQSPPARLQADDNHYYKSIMTRPEPGGSLMRIVDIPPDESLPPISPKELSIEIPNLIGPLNNFTQTPIPHSDSLDYCIVIIGELWLILDNDQVMLSAGDTIIQRNTKHSWSNRTNKMARLAIIALDK